ncbi:nuclear transport factor 2 family protein [Terracidiphilus gabretensis]|uniref:nuclear transport factor 2 family protein n=1 Tax=Terracidiphilus gabretensis TaxID=1577687 RepID=UPI00071B127D|nr:nuclear transport factor 2 family protein [Terracidiphilus gabretensis]
MLLKYFFSCLLAAAVLPAISQTSIPSPAGKWSGVFDMVHADGTVDPDRAFLELKLENGTLSGSAGSAPNQMSPITNAHVDGPNVSFDVAASAGSAVHFDLKLAGDHLSGSVTGIPTDPGTQIVVDTRRADAEWKTPEPVPHAPDQLFANVAALDKQLFDAYNSCDLATMSKLVADDLEFYHDKTGLAVGKAPFLEAIQNNICGKVHRELTPGTLEVHPLAHYGAVEIGMHRFTHPNQPSEGDGQAKFITVWRYRDGAWQLTRAISYDHEAAPDQAKQ